MKTAAILAAVLLVVALVVVPPYLREREKTQALSRCDELKAQRATMAGQGAEVTQLAILDTQIRLCYEAAGRVGANVDPSDRLDLGACSDRGQQIEREWTHYRSTSGEDAVKRNNTRQTILRLGEEMAACYRDVVPRATTAEQLEVLLASARRQYALSQERAACFRSGAAGCSRFGLNEDHGNDRALQEEQRIGGPLLAVIQRAVRARNDITRRAALDAAALARGSGT